MSDQADPKRVIYHVQVEYAVKGSGWTNPHP